MDQIDSPMVNIKTMRLNSGPRPLPAPSPPGAWANSPTNTNTWTQEPAL